MIADSTLLSSCFVILEQAVVYVANLSEQTEHSGGIPKHCNAGLMMPSEIWCSTLVPGFHPGGGGGDTNVHCLQPRCRGGGERALASNPGESSLSLSTPGFEASMPLICCLFTCLSHKKSPSPSKISCMKPCGFHIFGSTSWVQD